MTQPTYYQITISRNIPNSLEPVSPPEQRGFVDHKNAYKYIQYDSQKLPIPSSLPSTFDLSLQKERAYFRYEFMILNLLETTTYDYIINQTATGAGPDNSPTSFSMVCVNSRPDSIYTQNELFGVSGHPTENIEVLTGLDAIKRQVARTFVTDYLQRSRQGFNPDDAAPPVFNTSPMVDLDILAPAVGATLADKIDYVEANITVVQVPNT